MPLKFLITLFVTLALMGVTNVSAQIPDSGMAITLSPRTPGPGEDTVARLESFSYDLNRAVISWFIDGSLELRGAGATEIRITAKNAGTPTLIRVRAESSEFGIQEITETIRPVGLDLIYEAESYAPPLYRGRALGGFGAPVRVVAIPLFKPSVGAVLKPETLIYIWEKNGTVIQAASGVGKQTYAFTDISLTREGESDIAVSVSSPDGSLSVRKSVFIRPFDTKVLLYRDDPLLGVVYERAMGEQFNLVGEEVALVASPYFFSTSRKETGKLEYRWTINGTTVSPAGVEKSRLLLRREGSSVGESSVSVSVQNLTEILQNAGAVARVMWGE